MVEMLNGKVALITGGGRGIGRHAAQLFAREGARVVVADVIADSVRKIAKMINGAGGEATPVVADVARPAGVTAMVETAIKTYGRLDCAFNNAGIAGSALGVRDKRTAEWPEEAFHRIIEVNFKGVLLCMLAELEHMVEQGGGCIVNTSSLAGLTGFANTSAYTASKHGLVGLTKTAALEYAPDIRVNCVCPGWIDTEMNTETMKLEGAEIVATLPFGKLGRPEDIAEMA
jgi:NAD(P)-dependent dehydrogenase (short-subunit alcohol dehydrogenase family)